MTTTGQLRPRLHALWASVADHWGTYADELDELRGPITAAMLARSGLQPGERVLELACGPAGTGLAAAEQVGPDGEVVLTDVVPEMTAIAAARAQGLGNVCTRVADMEDLAEPACSFDVVLCREGLMFAANPALAAAEIRRVLRPGGRVVLAVWGPRERNPWLGLLFDAVADQLGHPVPPPGMPGPFALSDADKLAEMLRGTGLDKVTVEEMAAPTRAGSFDAWRTRTAALAGPLASILAAMPDDGRRALWDRLRDDVRPYQEPDGSVELPGVTLLATAYRRALPGPDDISEANRRG